ncbi:MAG: hypothetical protein LBH41_02215, partial [Rickettsiales bacterium]|nr:hypothetical protein [Rickettsiales bacterium]
MAKGTVDELAHAKERARIAEEACGRIRGKDSLSLALGFAGGGGSVSAIAGGLSLAGQIKNKADTDKAKAKFEKDKAGKLAAFDAQKTRIVETDGTAEGVNEDAGKVEAEERPPLAGVKPIDADLV